MIQAGRYIIEHCRLRYLDNVDGLCNFPTIILHDQGHLIAAFVAVFITDKLYLQYIDAVPLRSMDSLTTHTAGARFFAALRVALRSLRSSYPTLLSDATRQPHFPFPRSFHIGTTEVPFTYVDFVDPSKRLFTATCEYGGAKRKICVKFTLRYSQTAHDAAHRPGFAPQLLAVRRLHEWYMVVTEDISDQYTPLYNLKKSPFELSQATVMRVHAQVRQALESLHDEGFVHGDVRDVSVLVLRHRDSQSLEGGEDEEEEEEEEEEVKIMLSDWDWAGPIGEARYPYQRKGADASTITRPEGAISFALIEPAHDLQMADWLHLPPVAPGPHGIVVFQTPPEC